MFNRICCNKGDLQNNCKQLLNTLTKRGYNKTDVTAQIICDITIPRNKVKTSNLKPLIVTYKSALPGFKNIILKIKIERNLCCAYYFAIPKFQRSKNFRDMIEGNSNHVSPNLLNTCSAF